MKTASRLTRQSPQFIGNSQRSEKICEDVPVATQILQLNAFDPTQCGVPLCYSIIPNDYFTLMSAQQPAINGNVILKKALDLNAIKIQSVTATINFTAQLFYCNQPGVLDEQLIVFTVLGVNKYPPVIAQQVFNKKRSN